MSGQEHLFPLPEPDHGRIPTAQLKVGPDGCTAAPEHGRWAGNLEISTRKPGDALYLLKLLLLELAERNDVW